MGLLQGKVVAITGAGRGLGRGYAFACAAAGAQVVVNDRGGSRDGSGDPDARVAERVASEVRHAGGDAMASAASVTTEDGARQLVQTALDTFGRLDVLVNNAGTLNDRALPEMSLELWESVVEVHLTGTYLCSRYAALQMIDQGEGGRIINTTSMAGLIGNPGQSNYASAKAGIVGLTRTTALELARVGITVNAIAPIAKTRLTAEVDGISSSSRAELVAPVVVYLASDLSKDVTGRVLGVHGNHIFEYRTEMTRGVDRGGTPWLPEEIGASLAEIGRSEAERLRRSAGASGADEDAPAGQAALGIEVFRAVIRGFRPKRAGDWSAVMHFQVEQCGCFTLTVEAGTIAVISGSVGEPTCLVAMDAPTFFGMASGAVDGEEAFMQGKISASNMSDLVKYTTVINQRRARSAVAEVLAAHGATPTGELS